jgi:uncharacterized protein YeeX (DUF496 family)
MLAESAKLEEDIKAGKVTLDELVVRLWRRVNELQRELDAANKKIENLEDRTGVPSGPGSTGRGT